MTAEATYAARRMAHGARGAWGARCRLCGCLAGAGGAGAWRVQEARVPGGCGLRGALGTGRATLGGCKLRGVGRALVRMIAWGPAAW